MSKADELLDAIQGTAPLAPKPKPTPLPEPEEAPVFEREGTSWAQDVYWVFNNHSNRVTKQSAGTSSRWGLYQYAKKNMDTFMGTLVPRAMMLLEKAREKLGDSDDIVAEERKSIRELKGILTAAIAEATGELD